MHTVGSAGEGNVCAGVYQNTSIQFVVLCFQLDDFVGQGFEVVGGEVFFAQLDVVHAAASRLGDGCEQLRAAEIFVTRELRTVGDVVEEQGSLRSTVFSHRPDD